MIIQSIIIIITLVEFDISFLDKSLLVDHDIGRFEI